MTEGKKGNLIKFVIAFWARFALPIFIDYTFFCNCLFYEHAHS